MGEIDKFEILKETVIELNTSKGQNAAHTSQLMGKLECIIIKVENPTTVIINSTHGYNILTKRCNGIVYVLPRHKTQEPKENLLGGLQLDKFLINESLDILLDGQANTDIKIILRFS